MISHEKPVGVDPFRISERVVNRMWQIGDDSVFREISRNDRSALDLIAKEQF
jgi:hypothetical protein